MAQKQIADDFHLRLSIGKSLLDDLVKSMLPYTVKEGQFDLGRNLHQGVRQLQVKQKVVALLEDRQPPDVVRRAKNRAADLWRGRRGQVYQIIDEIVHVDGDWKFQVDQKGTEATFEPRKLGVEAHVSAVATGTAYLLRRNVEVPFTIEKPIGAKLFLGDIRYDQAVEAVVAQVQQPEIDLGSHAVWQVLSRVVNYLLENNLDKVLPEDKRNLQLSKEKLSESLAGVGGNVLNMGVDTIDVEVTEADATIKVKFGFSQKQIAGD